jgi:hypothetical protein
LATLPTFSESGVAVCQTGGWDPHRGIRISDAPAGGPQSAGVAPSAPAMAPSAPAVAPRPLDKGKGLQAVPPPLVAPRGQKKRGDVDCAAPMGHLYRSPRSVRGLLVGPRRTAPVGVLGPTAHPGLPLKVFSRSRTVSTTVAKWFVPIARETVDKIYRFGPLRDA